MLIDLTKDQILALARQYSYDSKDVYLAELMVEAAKRGFMTLDDLVKVAEWKWRGGRTRQLAKQNTDEDVRAVTAISFSAKSERVRVGVLLSLDGVRWPVLFCILRSQAAIRSSMFER